MTITSPGTIKNKHFSFQRIQEKIQNAVSKFDLKNDLCSLLQYYNNCFQKWQLERKFERNSFKQSEKGNVL